MAKAKHKQQWHTCRKGDDDMTTQVAMTPSITKPASISVSTEMIHVDRTLRPTYPDWMAEDGVQHPELELTGPAEFDVANLEQWIHPEQVNGWTTGQVIYDHLKANNMLADCLGLADLLAIQAKGLDFFHKYFDGKSPFGWKGAVRHRYGPLFVPFLFELAGEVVLYWRWLDGLWSADGPALRFAK
ncbi:hypothetical protein IT399_01095 [Candidatus Nomurabacteria bacterium]|nr:hypothetical protein [Candidatus Nomurabacteria bacterium]